MPKHKTNESVAKYGVPGGFFSGWLFGGLGRWWGNWGNSFRLPTDRPSFAQRPRHNHNEALIKQKLQVNKMEFALVDIENNTSA